MAAAVEIGTREVLWMLMGIGCFVAAIGYVGRTALRKINGHANDMEATLAKRYKELYEVERTSNDQTRQQIAELRLTIDRLTRRIADVEDENRRLQRLNMELQEKNETLEDKLKK